MGKLTMSRKFLKLSYTCVYQWIAEWMAFVLVPLAWQSAVLSPSYNIDFTCHCTNTVSWKTRKTFLQWFSVYSSQLFLHVRSHVINDVRDKTSCQQRSHQVLTRFFFFFARFLDSSLLSRLGNPKQTGRNMVKTFLIPFRAFWRVYYCLQQTLSSSSRCILAVLSALATITKQLLEVSNITDT